MTEITISAVTRLSSGVCVAGINNDGMWVRPTQPNAANTWRQLKYDDCKDANGQWIVRKGNRVKMDLVKPIPDNAHSEDWLIGSRKPELLEKLSEDGLRTVCEKFTEKSMDAIDCDNANRSLILIHPDKVFSFSFQVETNWEGQRKYIPRCTFSVCGRSYPDIGITDAEWRGYGRQIMLKYGEDCQLPANKAYQQNGTEDNWFVIGRNLLTSSKFYLLIVGIHLFPVRHFEMDFKRL